MLYGPVMQRDWIAQPEQIVHDKDEYHFAVEEFRCGEKQMLFLHLTIHKWSPSVYKEILRNWKLFREFVTCPVFATGGHVTDTLKWEHFVSRLGFKFLQDVVLENGAERQLFVHKKEQQENDQFDPNHKPIWNHGGHQSVNHEPVVGATAVSAERL